jgi:3-mercaptopyruvate sulfurtransferase SseA
VVYGRDTEGDPNEKWPGRRAGQIAATRALMILRYAGVDDVRLLDGGYDWWVQAGNPLETEIRQASPVAAFGVPVPLRPEVIVDIEEAKAIIADPAGAALVSVRTWKEHIGKVSGYNYIGPAGRIAGDVWGNCGTDAYHMQHYRNVDNTMRAYPEITANWAEAGITADKWVAFYCGTGWRASETWFYAWLQGWSNVAVYDGGWFEWSKDPVNNPIEVGVPEDVFAALAWASWICLKTLPMPGRIRARWSAAASRSRRRARSASRGSSSSLMAGTCRWLAHAVNPVRRSPGLAADAHRQARVGSSLRVRETATPSLIETDGIAKGDDDAGQDREAAQVHGRRAPAQARRQEDADRHERGGAGEDGQQARLEAEG